MDTNWLSDFYCNVSKHPLKFIQALRVSSKKKKTVKSNWLKTK